MGAWCKLLCPLRERGKPALSRSIVSFLWGILFLGDFKDECQNSCRLFFHTKSHSFAHHARRRSTRRRVSFYLFLFSFVFSFVFFFEGNAPSAYARERVGMTLECSLLCAITFTRANREREKLIFLHLLVIKSQKQREKIS